jgi:hypothetical protein
LLVHGRPSTPPIYDGIAIPPAPYRFESPPPNLRNGNQPPLSGTATIPVQNGQVMEGGVTTADNQVTILFGIGTFTVAGGASSIRCTVEPLKDPPPAPAGSQIQGNVYRISCVGQPTGTVSTTTAYRLTLRLPPGKVNHIGYYDGHSWRALTTTFAPGGDPYAGAHPIALGDVAALGEGGSGSGTVFGDLARYLEFFGILGLVVVFGVIAVIQEIRRRRLRAPGGS